MLQSGPAGLTSTELSSALFRGGSASISRGDFAEHSESPCEPRARGAGHDAATLAHVTTPSRRRRSDLVFEIEVDALTTSSIACGAQFAHQLRRLQQSRMAPALTASSPFRGIAGEARRGDSGAEGNAGVRHRNCPTRFGSVRCGVFLRRSRSGMTASNMWTSDVWYLQVNRQVWYTRRDSNPGPAD